MFIRVNQVNSQTLQFKNEIGINTANITQFWPRQLTDSQTNNQVVVTVVNLVGYPEEELFIEETFDQLASVLPVTNTTAAPTSGALDYCSVTPSPAGALQPAAPEVALPLMRVDRIMNNNQATLVPVAINPTAITWFEPFAYQDRATGGWRTDAVLIHTGGAPIRQVPADVTFDDLCTFLYAFDVVP